MTSIFAPTVLGSKVLTIEGFSGNTIGTVLSSTGASGFQISVMPASANCSFVLQYLQYSGSSSTSPPQPLILRLPPLPRHLSLPHFLNEKKYQKNSHLASQQPQRNSANENSSVKQKDPLYLTGMDTVTLNEVTFVNCFGSAPGAFYFQDIVSLSISNCLWIQNTMPGSGNLVVFGKPSISTEPPPFYFNISLMETILQYLSDRCVSSNSNSKQYLHRQFCASRYSGVLLSSSSVITIST